MRHRIRVTAALTLVVLLASTPSHAQFVVYDPTNYIQALSRYAQMLEQYRFWVKQARRIPVDMAARYRVPEVRWRTHDIDVEFPFARSILTGLNYGDATGSLYKQGVDTLSALNTLLPMVPASLQRRLQADYGTIELADSVTNMGIHQVGAIRYNGRSVLQSILNMDTDAFDDSDSYNSQIAVLNKINGANVLALRVNETTSQFLMHILEQLLVQNIRARDAEAAAMDARLYQWQYGTAYGRELFANTADALDTWRQP